MLYSSTEILDAGLGAAAEVHVLAGVVRGVVVVVGAAAAVPGAVLVVPVAAAGGAVIAVPACLAAGLAEVRVVVVAADLLELVVLAHVGAAGLAVADGRVHVAVAAVLEADAAEALEAARARARLAAKGARRRAAAVGQVVVESMHGRAVVVGVVLGTVPGAELQKEGGG